MKKKVIFVFLFFPILVFAVSLTSETFENGIRTNSLRLNHSQTLYFNISGSCKAVTNNSGTHIYMPTRPSDFSNFEAKKPSGVSVNPCPVDCVGSWGACVAGIETYSISTPAASGGASCEASHGATRPNASCAPVNCVGGWGSCVAGIETFSIITPASGGGAACATAHGATRPNPTCAPVNCVGSWGPCIAGFDTYTITTPAANGGASCPVLNGASRVNTSCIAENGVCGSSKGTCSSSLPSTGLNPAGSIWEYATASSATWICPGKNGGTDASCSKACSSYQGSKIDEETITDIMQGSAFYYRCGSNIFSDSARDYMGRVIMKCYKKMCN